MIISKKLEIQVRELEKKAIVSYISKITLKVFIKVISNLKSKLPEKCSKKDLN